MILDELAMNQDPVLDKLDRYVCNFYNKDDSPTWENFLTINACHTEFQKDVEFMLGGALGYLPSIRIYADYLPFLNTLFHQDKIGQHTPVSFYEEFTSIVRQIRSHQMKVENRLREYTNTDYQDYYSIGKKYKQEGRKLLFEMLGIDLKYTYSLEAELILRRHLMITKDPAYTDYSASHYLAATIGLYRYNYFEYGEKVANELPLLGYSIPRKKNLPTA